MLNKWKIYDVCRRVTSRVSRIIPRRDESHEAAASYTYPVCTFFSVFSPPLFCTWPALTGRTFRGKYLFHARSRVSPCQFNTANADGGMILVGWRTLRSLLPRINSPGSFLPFLSSPPPILEFSKSSRKNRPRSDFLDLRLSLLSFLSKFFPTDNRLDNRPVQITAITPPYLSSAVD